MPYQLIWFGLVWFGLDLVIFKDEIAYIYSYHLCQTKTSHAKPCQTMPNQAKSCQIVSNCAKITQSCKILPCHTMPTYPMIRSLIICHGRNLFITLEPLDGFSHMRGHFGVVFQGKFNGEVTGHSCHRRKPLYNFRTIGNISSFENTLYNILKT